MSPLQHTVFPSRDREGVGLRAHGKFHDFRSSESRLLQTTPWLAHAVSDRLAQSRARIARADLHFADVREYCAQAPKIGREECRFAGRLGMVEQAHDFAVIVSAGEMTEKRYRRGIGGRGPKIEAVHGGAQGRFGIGEQQKVPVDSDFKRGESVERVPAVRAALMSGPSRAGSGNGPEARGGGAERVANRA